MYSFKTITSAFDDLTSVMRTYSSQTLASAFNNLTSSIIMRLEIFITVMWIVHVDHREAGTSKTEGSEGQITRNIRHPIHRVN